MLRSASMSSSASSQGALSTGEAASSGRTNTVDPVAPPRVASTARRHVAAHTAGDGSSRGSLDDHTIEHLAGRAASLTPSGLLLPSQGTPRSLPSPTTSRGRLRARRVSSAEALRQRLQSTLAITDAEAARAARAFSMNMYRELHQRKFASQHEELDFLRIDFVASRKTLALLHEDNLRLQRELLDRVHEVEELREKLAEVYRGEEPQYTTGPSPRSSASAMPRLGSRRGSPATSSRRSSSGGPRELTVMWADPPTHQPEEEGKETASAGAAAASVGSEQSEQCISVEARTPPAVQLPKSGNATAHTQQQQQQRTPLSLYAKTTVKRSSRTPGASTDVDLRELVRDLRANLARRDTALDETQMDLAALRNESQQLRGDLNIAQADAAHAKQQRDVQQRAATAAQERAAAQEQELRECRSTLQQVTKEKEAMQQKLTTAELLYEHAGGVKADGAATPDMHLREQLQMYRAKWQTAEDEVEHVHQRLSQLQLQLLRQGGRDGGGAAALTAASPTSEKETDSGRLLEVTAQQRAEHATELAELRRQHQEQLRLHAEELQRVQRRLDRAQESATFHEDQLRQQRQDDSREHHKELQALQAQLRTAQTELVQAQHDREHLARQLRRSTEQETTVEVLRGQVEQLKQRMAEVGADLAQGRGREKETQLHLQRERLTRVKAEHDAEVATAAQAQAAKEVRFLQEEVSLLREQLGMQEASAVPPKRKTAEDEAVGSSSGGGTAGDAAALASELKGYVSLMRVNATLQRRIEELEAELAQRQTNTNTAVIPTAVAAAAAVVPPPPQPSTSRPTALEVEQQVRLEALRRELDDSLQAQHLLAVSQAAGEKEQHVLAQDNATLASGVELLQRRLAKAQAALIVEQARRRHASRQRSADKEKEKRRRRDASIVPPPQETSRVRRRLQTARATDQESVHGAALKDRIAEAAASSDREGTSSCHHAPCCCCCGRCSSSSSSPASAPSTLHMFCHHHFHQDVATHTPPPPPPPLMSASSPSSHAIGNGVRTSTTASGSLENTVPSPKVSLNPPPSPSPPPAVSVAPPPSPSGATAAAAAAPSTASTPPPLTDIAVAPAKAPTRCDAASSPLHRPRQHVYGSVLPPVLYPALVLKTRA